ncbi:hypothetical protein LTR78_010420 [Recurvomyces mirabilis]|uniref:NmrA-like domain-containing protein n=1 Tax=Recurvomyces mirabilis TaxID=574656 RepID=A0AAE0WI85_9PEZI|nr:hypothetical protein LTR78_010420 [Recurvomyces mirabilis]KAK5150498.1 hypothetical protein LTS14_009991 [Recurvomyces mirabilis]
MSDNHIRKIALVGASGNIGSTTLTHLLHSPHPIHITAISRPDSTATFPTHSRLTVLKGSYDDPTFLAQAFAGQDLVMFALSFMALNAEKPMIEAAAIAGVKWIVPNEYAGDGLNKSMVEGVPVFGPKRETRRYVEELAGKYEGLKWIGVATNPFLEFCLGRKLFGIDQDEKTATIYPDAGSFNTSTMEMIGLAIARMLALPISNSEDKRSSLEYYANNFLYVSSFCVTQRQLLASVQKATGTKEAEWKVDESKTVKGWVEECREGLKKGDMKAGWGLTFAYYMGEGLGGNYESKAREDRRVLGLPEEDLDEIVKGVVGGGK